MSRLRTGLLWLVSLFLLLTALIVAPWPSSTARSTASTTVLPARTPAEQDLVASVSPVERLEQRVQNRQPLPPSTRDPFKFREHDSTTSSRRAPSTTPALSTRTLSPALPVTPDLTLAGIAEDKRGVSVVRTAILVSAGGLHLVKEGERLAGRFDVVTIEATAVRLFDRERQTAVTLVLR